MRTRPVVRYALLTGLALLALLLSSGVPLTAAQSQREPFVAPASSDDTTTYAGVTSASSVNPFSITNGQELKSALLAAATNGSDDVITLGRGTYLAQTDGPFTYEASEPYSLTITVEEGLEPGEVIIDGEEITRGLYLENTSAGGILLSGFTIENGKVVDDSGAGAYIATWGAVDVNDMIISNNQVTLEDFVVRGHGGGLSVEMQGSAPVTVVGNSLEGNGSTGSGGGLYLASHSPSITISDNRFSSNSAALSSGGGAFIQALYADLILRRNTFSGNSTHWVGTSGGGCAIDANDADIQIIENDFSGNTGIGFGGGLWVRNRYGDTLLEDNLVDGNQTTDSGGGGISVSGGVYSGDQYLGGQITLRDNTVRHNHAGSGGGGVALSNAKDIVLVNNVIVDNGNYTNGAGVWLRSSNGNVILTNNTVAYNEVETYNRQGGGLHLELGDGWGATANAQVYNNVIYENLMDYEADDIWVVNHPDEAGLYGSVTLHNNDYGVINQDAISYTIDLDANIQADPLFGDPYVGNYHLSTGSPCLDAGDDGAPELPATDRAGLARISGAHVDLGAYEGATEATPSAEPLQLVGQIGGSLNSVMVQGNYAYLGVGPRLVILNVSDLRHPALLGRTGARGVGGAVVVGDYAYGCAGTEGLGIVDISNPAAPSALGFYKTGEPARGVAVAGQHAYVVYGYRGLRILDISGPAHPTKVGSLNVLGNSCSVAVAGTYAYVGDCGRWMQSLHVVDISDPAHPDKVTSYELGGDVYRVLLVGSTAYIANGFGGLRILDLSDPENPSELGVYEPWGGYAWDVAVSGNYAYVADSRGLRIVNVSNPANPTEVGFHEMTDPAVHVAVAGGYAYVAEQHQGGLRILDVSDPAHPAQVGFYDTVAQAPEHAYDVAVAGGRGYVTDYWRGLSIVNVSNPASPTGAGFFETPAGETEQQVNSVALAGNHAYVANCYAGLRVVNISNPAIPSQVGVYTTTGCAHGVAAAGGYAYVAGGNSMDVVDITNPAAPTKSGSRDAPGQPMDVTVAGNTAYVADWSSGLSIVDVSDPAHPSEIGSYDVGWSELARGVAVAGGTAYVAVDEAGPAGSLRVVDVSNPISPTGIGRYNMPGTAFDVAVDGGFAYVADGSGGLQIVDVSDPEHPEAANSYGALYATGVTVAGGFIYLASFQEGLFILQFAPLTYASIPASGGSLTSPSDQTGYVFAAGTFTDTTTVIHTFRHPGDAPSLGSMAGIGHFFEVSAVDDATGQPVQPVHPYTVTIQYSDAEKGPVIEDTLALYYWDGTQWVEELSSVVDTPANTVTATPSRFSWWAILGEKRRVFLPLVLRNP